MPTLNATVFPDEAYVLVEADWSGTILRDTFDRTVANSWGTPDVGPIWTNSGGAGANRSVNGSAGIISHTAVNTALGQFSAVNALNLDMMGTFVNPLLPTGGDFEYGIFARFVDFNNFIQARIFMTTTGVVSCNIRQVIAGVQTASSTVNVPGVNSADFFAWRLLVDQGTVLLKVWRATDAQPLSWSQSFTTTWVTAGSVGVQTFIGAGVTNPLPVSFASDDFVFVDPAHVDPLYAGVTRRNTVTGEVVTLRPYIAYDESGNLLLDCGLGLWWDTEPPLNVPLEYCAVAADVPLNLVQNGSFETITAPWVASGGALVSSGTFAHDGVSSGRFTPDGVTFTPNISQPILGLVFGQPITVSTWVLTPQGWNSVRLQLVVNYTDGRVDTFTTPVEILDDNEWRQLQLTADLSTTVSSATLTFYMTGTPPATTLFYIDDVQVSQPVDVTATACETVTVASESVWLKNPLNPCLDVEIGLCSPAMADCEEPSRVSYVGHADDEWQPNTTLLTPVNRRYPIPVNRVRRAPTSTLRVLAHDCAARDAVLASNDTGDPLLFQAPATYCIPDRYISVGALTDSRISVDQREDFRLISMPYATVQRPEGPANGVCGARIIDLCDIYTSWAAMTIAGLTWTDLLLGLASPDGPGQPQPPATARVWADVESDFASWAAVEADGTWADIRDGT